VADDPGLLVSFTDEDDLALFAWARPQRDSRLAGIGVDVASAKDFAGERGERFNRLIFSEHEQEFVRTYYFDDPAIGFAYAFSAKEAAFKATAQPLRSWYRHHDEELAFEVRHFSLTTPHVARGELRDAAAQYALDKMRIARIVVNYTQVEGVALVVATSLSE
jgi:phosphopantetheinyl transferase (holo-ACP synthase)